ncbi:hypothetical protein [Paraurantiacibacter namhicola]|uniref:Uncharacterized protein n=1 Tax=Paraurantiacibacter namhicola TaxID=645517 RepID=A0A1C7D5N5_9SPHN|nr:hypothetical protein [Paraurantiacibacter namhicola]ANU06613.1 hypothetical protein A6F65_00286 [Paraurantiacibacter namhicola]
MSGELLKFGLSLVAICAMIGLVVLLKLGREAEPIGEEEALRLAQHAFPGFDTADVAVLDAKDGALVRGESGRCVLVYRHGSKFAAGLVTRAAQGSDGEVALSLSGRSAQQLVRLPSAAQGWVQHLADRS